MLFAVSQNKNRKKRGNHSISKSVSGGSFRKRQQLSSFIALFAGIALSSAVAGCTTAGSGQSADNSALGGQLAPKQTVKHNVHAKTAARAQTAALNYAQHGYSKIGNASWYGGGFQGKRTASGEIFNKYALTAAHRSMPLPSYARVTNMANGASVIVRVNDRGPFVRSRLIDLSQGAAQLLGYSGTAQVKVDYVGPAPSGGHDEAFLRASYHPAAGMPQVQENAGKPLAYGESAGSQPSGEKALDSLTSKKTDTPPEKPAAEPHEPIAAAETAQMAKASGNAGKPAQQEPVRLGFNMTPYEYNSKVRPAVSVQYQSPDLQDN